MAFESAKLYDFVPGDLRFTAGTFTNGAGDSGGDIYTGLQKCEGMILQQQGSAVIATQAVINETFPKADPITVVTATGADGWWVAFGH